MLSVRGCFSGDGWRGPFVRAKVAVPRLAVSAFSPLLADTGADRTAIRRDGRQLLADAGGRILPPDARLSIGGAPDRRRGIPFLPGRDFFGPAASSPACRADRLVITQPR